MLETFSERRAEWLKMLRSGEYSQATEQLYDGAGYCCLGVACKLYNQETGLGYFDSEAETSFVINGGSDGETLPVVVQEWFGFKVNTGNFNISVDPEYTDLASMNDSGKFSFKEIADFVETNPKGLWYE